MRCLGYFFLGCLLLAALKIAIQLAALAMLAVFVWLAFTRPRETLRLVFGLLLLGLLGRYPFVFAVLLLAALLINWLARSDDGCGD